MVAAGYGSHIENGDFCAYAYFPQKRVRYVPYEELAKTERLS